MEHYIMPGIDSDIQSIGRLENLPTIGLSKKIKNSFVEKRENAEMMAVFIL